MNVDEINLDYVEERLLSIEEVVDVTIDYNKNSINNEIVWALLGKYVHIFLRDKANSTIEKIELFKENIEQKIYFLTKIKKLQQSKSVLQNEIEELKESQNELMLIFDDLQQQNAALEQINQINRFIHGSNENISELLRKITMYIANLVSVERAILYFAFKKSEIADESGDSHEVYYETYGFNEDFDVDMIFQKFDLYEQVLRKGEVIEKKVNYDIDITTGDITSIFAMPIYYDNKIVGVVVLFNKAFNDFSNQDIELLTSILNQTLTALKNIRLIKYLKELFVGTILALSSAIDAKDPYTYGHSERVMQFSISIMHSMEVLGVHKFDEIERIKLRLSSILHDIGKIGTKESILRKPSRLTDNEYDHIKMHPVEGAKIISNISNLRTILAGIKYHHERYDGKGYPEGLKGNEIPLLARIIAVADTFDAMTSNRPYRKGLPLEVAYEEINKYAGIQFDPDVVKAFNYSYETGALTHIMEEFKTTTLKERIEKGYFIDELNTLFY